MAHYMDMGIADVSFLADEDMTAKQYYFVTVASTAGYVKTANGASNPTPVGVLQNSPSLGQEARVRVFGFSKVAASIGTGTCGLKFGRYFTTASAGLAVVPDTTDGSVVLGRWYDGSLTCGLGYGQAFIVGGGFATCGFAAS